MLKSATFDPILQRPHSAIVALSNCLATKVQAHIKENQGIRNTLNVGLFRIRLPLPVTTETAKTSETIEPCQSSEMSLAKRW